MKQWAWNFQPAAEYISIWNSIIPKYEEFSKKCFLWCNYRFARLKKTSRVNVRCSLINDQSNGGNRWYLRKNGQKLARLSYHCHLSKFTSSHRRQFESPGISVATCIKLSFVLIGFMTKEKEKNISDALENEAPFCPEMKIKSKIEKE